MADVTDINDLYEPGDDREPGEPEIEPQLDLGAVEESIRVYYGGSDDDSGKAAEELLMVVSRLAAELREARERLAGFEALPTREEWVVTGGPNFPAEPSGPPVSPDKGVLAYVNRHEAARLWRRKLSVHPYEPIADESPF